MKVRGPKSETFAKKNKNEASLLYITSPHFTTKLLRKFLGGTEAIDKI